MANPTDGRFAAIDIGTVTCRMLIADVVDGRVVPVAKRVRDRQPRRGASMRRAC